MSASSPPLELISPLTLAAPDCPVVHVPLRERQAQILAAADLGKRGLAVDHPPHLLFSRAFLEAFIEAAGDRLPARAAVPLGAVHEAYGPNLLALGRTRDDTLLYDLVLRRPDTPAPALADVPPVTVAAAGRAVRTPQPGRSEYDLVSPQEPRVIWSIVHWSDVLAANLLLLPSVLAEAELGVDPSAEVHPTAVVEGSRIGPGVQVGPFCVVRGSILEEGVILEEYASAVGSAIGKGTRVQCYAQVRGSVVGAGCVVGFRTNHRGSVTLDGSSSSAPVLPRSLVGRGAFLGRGVNISITNLVNTPIAVQRGKRRASTGTRTLGAAIGDGARVAVHALPAGFEVPAGYYIADRGLSPLPGDLPLRTPLVEVNGAFRNLSLRRSDSPSGGDDHE